jgi:hypothetical protein
MPITTVEAGILMGAARCCKFYQDITSTWLIELTPNAAECIYRQSKTLLRGSTWMYGDCSLGLGDPDSVLDARPPR